MEKEALKSAGQCYCATSLIIQSVFLRYFCIAILCVRIF